MIDVNQNNRITLTIVDSFSVPLFLNKGTDLKPLRYKLHETDKVYLAIMEANQTFENAIVKKVYTYLDANENGDIEISIEHDDTRCLVPGKYFYQIKMLYTDDKGKQQVNTVIQKTEFWIEE